jgi:hypothetical protein
VVPVSRYEWMMNEWGKFAPAHRLCLCGDHSNLMYCFHLVFLVNKCFENWIELNISMIFTCLKIFINYWTNTIIITLFIISFLCLNTQSPWDLQCRSQNVKGWAEWNGWGIEVRNSPSLERLYDVIQSPELAWPTAVCLICIINTRWIKR